MADFEAGDVVRVKGQYVLMTVTTGSYYDMAVYTIWFDGNKPRYGMFPAKCLEKIDEKSYLGYNAVVAQQVPQKAPAPDKEDENPF